MFGKGSAKLRKVSLNAFDADDAEETHAYSSNNTNTNVSNTGSVAASTSTPTNTSSNLVDPAQSEVVTKTALWIFNNSDKAAALVDKSRGNPTLDFLNDHTGSTAAGRLYLKELQRLRTEKEVQSVCSGVTVAPVVHASQIANFIAMNKQADFGAMMAHSAYTAQAAVSSSSSSAVAAVPRERERKNRWGPSVEAPTPSAALTNNTQPHSIYMPVAQVPQQSGVASSSSAALKQKDRHRSSDAESHEAAQIAQLAANFDSSEQQDTERIEKLLREQKEMQLLESRIRDAASQSMGAGAGTGSRDVTEVAKFLATNAHKDSYSGNSAQSNDTDPYAVNLQARKGPALLIAEKQAALYLERLAQYQELAALDDDKFRDTNEDCERNGGVIEGGTWEHRKRAKEMLNTAAKSLELTLLGAGKHHMADYLPPDVLQSFLKNAENVKSGTGSVAVSNEVNKIEESNVGYQLLRKSGWSEGAGLGAQSTGIVNPISALGNNVVMSSTSSSSGSGAGGGAGSGSHAPGVVLAGGRGPEGAGIGVHATHEVTAEDSEFDQYRKRMMLAYRFRPNPLNNPRRNYY